MKKLRAIPITLVFLALGATLYAQQDLSDREVIGTARSIAIALRNLPEAKSLRDKALLSKRQRDDIKRLRSVANARKKLLRVLEQDLSYVTVSSVAYALYLVDSDQSVTAVRHLVRQLNRMIFSDHVLAQRLLVAMGSAAVPTLTEFLSSNLVVQVLGAMGRDAASGVPALIEVLGTDNVEVAIALTQIGTPKAIAAAKPVLLKAIRDPYNHYAGRAAKALGRQFEKSKFAAGPLRELARRAQDKDTRVYAAAALTRIGAVNSGVKFLGELALDHELHLRYLVIRELARLGPKAKAAVPSLLEVLLDESDTRYGDRVQAAAALKKIDPKGKNVSAAIAKAALLPQMKFQLEKEGLLLKRR